MRGKGTPDGNVLPPHARAHGRAQSDDRSGCRGGSGVPSRERRWRGWPHVLGVRDPSLLVREPAVADRQVVGDVLEVVAMRPLLNFGV